MDKQAFLKAVKEARAKAKKRNFEQSFEISIALRNVDLKKPENRIEDFVVLPKGRGKPVKIAAIVDKELVMQAKKVCDHVITKDDLKELAGKARQIRKLVRSYDYFIAQGNLMTEVAKVMGKYLGAKGKMPNPKAGMIITPNTDLKALVERLRRTVKIAAKKSPVINAPIGSESMSDEDVADNAHAVYDAVRKKLPLGEQQIKRVFIKLTMGPAVKV